MYDFRLPALPLKIIIAQVIYEALKRNEWNATKTANELDISPRGISLWKQKLIKIGYELQTPKLVRPSRKGVKLGKYKQKRNRH